MFKGMASKVPVAVVFEGFRVKCCYEMVPIYGVESAPVYGAPEM